MEILRRTKVPRKGFAGVREHRLVMDPRLFGDDVGAQSWPGSANLVYLADARFMPGGETEMRDHRNIDVITLLLEGRLEHRGSLQDGTVLVAGDARIQRAGSEGFSHNEVNPDESECRLIQLWILPGTNSGAASYYSIRAAIGSVTRIYGGVDPTSPITQSTTLVDIATLKIEQSVDIDVPFLAYICRGKGFANEEMVFEGDLLRGEQLTFDAASDAQLVIVHQAS